GFRSNQLDLTSLPPKASRLSWCNGTRYSVDPVVVPVRGQTRSSCGSRPWKGHLPSSLGDQHELLEPLERHRWCLSIGPISWIPMTCDLHDVPVSTEVVARLNSPPSALPCHGIIFTGTVVEDSTNLSDWTPLVTNTLSTGSLYFTDPSSTNSLLRFYRARYFIW